MDIVMVLLVLVVLDGEAKTFAVKTEGAAHCMVLESKLASVLPQMLGRKPQIYAASCAEVKMFVTAP